MSQTAASRDTYNGVTDSYVRGGTCCYYLYHSGLVTNLQLIHPLLHCPIGYIRDNYWLPMFLLCVSHVAKWRCVELLVTTFNNSTLLLASGVVSGRAAMFPLLVWCVAMFPLLCWQWLLIKWRSAKKKSTLLLAWWIVCVVGWGVNGRGSRRRSSCVHWI